MGLLLTNEVLEQHVMEVFNFIQRHCIYRARVKYSEPNIFKNPNTPVQSGRYQFYLMRALMNPHVNRMIGSLFWEMMWDVWKESKFQIAGIESSGIPLVLAITTSPYQAIDVDCNGFVIRKERKTTGVLNWTEGVIDPDLPVMIVDDVVNSGNQLLRSATIITELGLTLHPITFTILAFKYHKNLYSLFKRENFSLSYGERWKEGTYDDSMNLEIDFTSASIEVKTNE